MRRSFLALLLGALVLVLSVGVGASVAMSPQEAAGPQAGPHDLVGPLGLKQRELRARAVQMQLEGDISKNADVAKVGKDSGSHRAEYVELHRQGEDSIWTVLGRVRDTGQPALGGQRPARCTTRSRKPDRPVDNTTIWAPDFSQAYYREPAVLRDAGRDLDAQLLHRAVRPADTP